MISTIQIFIDELFTDEWEDSMSIKPTNGSEKCKDGFNLSGDLKNV